MKSRGAWLLVAALAAALTTGCAGSGKKGGGEFIITDPVSAWNQANAALEQGKATTAREACESVDFRFAADKRVEMEPLIRLCIADATFYKGGAIDYIDARQLYLDFVTLFGDHELAPYAQFQAGVCSLAQANHPSKDQSQTEAAFADLAEVSRRYPGTTYARAAEDMIGKAKSRLAEHEYLVGRFYLKRKAFTAAAVRFKGILEDFPDYPELQKVYYYLDETLLRADSNDQEGRDYLGRLIREFPRDRYATLAARVLQSYGPPVELSVDGDAD